MAAFNSVAVVLGPVGVVLGIAGKQAQPSTLQESSYVVDHRAPLVSAALALAAAGCGADSSATASPNSPGQKPRRTLSDRSSSSTRDLVPPAGAVRARRRAAGHEAPNDRVHGGVQVRTEGALREARQGARDEPRTTGTWSTSSSSSA